MHKPAFDEFKNPRLQEEHRNICAEIKYLISELEDTRVTNRRLGGLKVIQMTLRAIVRDQMHTALYIEAMRNAEHPNEVESQDMNYPEKMTKLDTEF